MAEDDRLEAARAMRRAMLGEAYVDAQTEDPNPAMREFSEYLTSMAWGVWARGGVQVARLRAGAYRGDRRRARRAVVPDRCVLRRAGRALGQAGTAGGAGRGRE